MSLCPSCAHQEDSWQHRASCIPVEAKVPQIRRRLEEPVPSRVRASRSASRGASPKVEAVSGEARSETPPPRSETPSEVSEQPKKGGRPKKWASDAERMRAARSKKEGAS